MWLICSVIGATGCKSRHADPCLAAVDHTHECWDWAPDATSPDSQSYLQECRGDEKSECIAECMADASCADYDYRAKEGCFPDSVTNCVNSCPDTHVSCDTPLVLALSGKRVHFTRSERPFDFGAAMSVITDWPSAATPWLAYDRNGNGSIDDGSELFGSGWRARDGNRAPNGFVALGELDSNRDGKITPEDDAWSQILVWRDDNADRRSSGDELSPLSQSGVVSVDLAYSVAPQCDARGNCEVERAAVYYLDAYGNLQSGSAIDVHLRHFQK